MIKLLIVLKLIGAANIPWWLIVILSIPELFTFTLICFVAYLEISHYLKWKRE